MTDTTLDAAIKSAHVEAGFGETFQVLPANREYARALISKLLEGMDDDAKELWTLRPDMGAGFVAAITEIRRRAGLEDKA